MVQLVKLDKKANTKMDMLKDIVQFYCYTKGIRLSDSQVLSLCFFIQYGLNEQTQEMIVKSNIVNEASLGNVMSRLRKYGFIKRVNKTDYLSDEFADIKADKVVGVMIKLTLDQ